MRYFQKGIRGSGFRPEVKYVVPGKKVKLGVGMERFSPDKVLARLEKLMANLATLQKNLAKMSHAIFAVQDRSHRRFGGFVASSELHPRQ